MFSTPFIAAFIPEVPARLVRPDRVVEPDVASRDQDAREPHVVVRQQDDLARETRELCEYCRDRADELLARLVVRVRLSREEDLHGPPLDRSGARRSGSRKIRPARL